MKVTFDTLTAPLAARLPDLSTVPPRRQITGALIASVLLHLLAFIGIGMMAWLLPERVETLAAAEPEQNALEVTIMPSEEEEPEPIIPQPPTLAAIDREGLEKSEVKPERPEFQSDEDIVAGSERVGKGQEMLPAQDGADLPFTNFNTQRGDSDGTPKETPNAGESQPAAAPLLSPMYKPRPLAKEYLEALARIESRADAAAALPPTPTPAEPIPPREEPPLSEEPPPALEQVATPRDNEIPIYTRAPATPPPATSKVVPQETRPRPIPAPAPSPAATPAPPPQEMAKLITPAPRPQPVKDPGYTPDRRQTRIEGAISNKGRPGVDALKTPLGVYRKEISQQIQSRWLYWTKKRMDLLALGTVRVRFYITQEGRVQEVAIVENDSNSTFASICEQAVREAEIEPPPADLELMKDGRLELVFSFTLYDTR